MIPLPAELLQAVLDDPHDDWPRLVCADFWEENGEPERAAYHCVACRAEWTDHQRWAAIKRGEWPYRSVEVRSWSVPRINAVALLSSDPPFFRFPMIAGVLLDESMPGAFAAMKFAAFEQEEPAVEPKKPDAPADSGALAKIEQMLGSLVAGMQKLLGGGDKAQGEVVAEPVTDTPPEDKPTEDAPAKDMEADAKNDDETEEDPMAEKKKEGGADMSAAPVAALAAIVATGAGQAVMSGVAGGRDLGALLAPSSAAPILACGLVGGAGLYLHAQLVRRLLAQPNNIRLALADTATSAISTTLSAWLGCLAYAKSA
jgi:uncharacterized protein (TIGR02996 family)